MGTLKKLLAQRFWGSFEWISVRFDWLMVALKYYRPIRTNACLSIRSLKSLRRKLIPNSPWGTVSGVCMELTIQTAIQTAIQQCIGELMLHSELNLIRKGPVILCFNLGVALRFVILTEWFASAVLDESKCRGNHSLKKKVLINSVLPSFSQWVTR